MEEDAASETVTLVGRDLNVLIDFECHAMALSQFSSMLVLPPPPQPPTGDNNHGAPEDWPECYPAAASQIVEEEDDEAIYGLREERDCGPGAASPIAAEEEGDDDEDMNHGAPEERGCHSAAAAASRVVEEEDDDEAPIGHPVRQARSRSSYLPIVCCFACRRLFVSAAEVFSVIIIYFFGPPTIAGVSKHYPTTR